MGGGADNQPLFPLYVVSKGRADTRLTVRSLLSMGVPFHVVIEEADYADYAAVIERSKLIVLDPAYQRDYETCDNLGNSRSKGPGPARNFVWDHAVAAGADWHWVMDDNIRRFGRFNRNLKISCRSPGFWRAMEDFCLRYSNVLMGGPNYDFFLPRKVGHKYPPFVLNTRIYSCNLIRNDAPYRWRGRYNEDTDLSLRMLKDGWCTVQFNAFIQYKAPTQTVAGGNTAEFYDAEGKREDGEVYANLGTLAKSQLQVRMHPDVSKLVWKFGRWHHEVNYRPFKKNVLLRKVPAETRGTNDYGMELKRVPGSGGIVK